MHTPCPKRQQASATFSLALHETSWKVNENGGPGCASIDFIIPWSVGVMRAIHILWF